MTVEDHINTEDDDNGKQQKCNPLEDAVVLGFIVLFPALLRFFFVFFLFFIAAQQDQYRAGGDKQHIGFTEGIKGTVIQNHTGNNIHSAGILQAVLNILGSHFVAGGIVRCTYRREVRNCRQQHQDQC